MTLAESKKEITRLNKLVESRDKELDKLNSDCEKHIRSLTILRNTNDSLKKTNENLKSLLQIAEKSEKEMKKKLKQYKDELQESMAASKATEISPEIEAELKMKHFEEFEAEARERLSDLNIEALKEEVEGMEEEEEKIPAYKVETQITHDGILYNLANNQNSKQGGFGEKQAEGIAKIYKNQLLPVLLKEIPEAQREDDNYILIYKGVTRQAMVTEAIKIGKSEED